MTDLAAALNVPALSSDEEALLLDAAREVAHGSQRRYAPLSSYLIGVAVGQAGGGDDALRSAVTAVLAALPDEQDPRAR